METLGPTWRGEKGEEKEGKRRREGGFKKRESEEKEKRNSKILKTKMLTKPGGNTDQPYKKCNWDGRRTTQLPIPRILNERLWTEWMQASEIQLQPWHFCLLSYMTLYLYFTKGQVLMASEVSPSLIYFCAICPKASKNEPQGGGGALPAMPHFRCLLNNPSS